MKYGRLIVEKKEYVIIKRALNLSRYQYDTTLGKSIKKLSKELESAQIYDEDEMPDDVVRLHSVITVISEKGWHKKFQLVLPRESDIKEDKISLLTPMGSAVIGYAQGDDLLWEFPAGEQKLTLKKVEQNKKSLNINMVL